MKSEYVSMRLIWRDFIKQTIRQVVINLEKDPFTLIHQAVKAEVPLAEQQDLQPLIIEELKRLH